MRVAKCWNIWVRIFFWLNSTKFKTFVQKIIKYSCNSLFHTCRFLYIYFSYVFLWCTFIIYLFFLLRKENIAKKIYWTFKSFLVWMQYRALFSYMHSSPHVIFLILHSFFSMQIADGCQIKWWCFDWNCIYSI